MAGKEYKNPKPTVDVIIEMPSGGIVLIERRNPPPGWAIPGGFVDEGEPLEEAALREMKEETGLEVVLTDFLYSYSDPRRDPRHHTVTAVFVGKPAQEGARPLAGDDAGAVRVVDPSALPSPMAFDHAKVIADYAVFKKTGRRPDPMQKLEDWRTKKPVT